MYPVDLDKRMGKQKGLAFATVAGIPLLYGLYIVWMPPFIYSLFGTSIHVSYGPFALMGLFMSNALEKRGYKPCDGICRHESEQIQVTNRAGRVKSTVRVGGGRWAEGM